MKNMIKNNDSDRQVKKGSLGTDTVKLTFSKFVTMAISLVSSMMLARFRSLEEYGTYSQLLLAIHLVSVIFMLGLPNSINYFLARAESNKERQKFLSVYYTLSTLLSIIVGIVLVCSIPLLEWYFKNPLIKSFFYFLAIYPWATLIQSGIENILIVYQKTNYLMVYRVSNSFLLLFIILVVQLLHWNFQAYMILFVAVQTIYAIAVYLISNKLAKAIRPKFNWALCKTIFAFSIPIGLATVIGTLNIELDKLLIGKMFNTEQLAIYTNASKEIPVSIIATSLTSVLLPQMARLLKKGKKKEAVNLWGNATVLSFSLICFVAVGLIAFAPDVITLLYSEKYLPGVNVFRIYSVVLILRCTYFGMILNATGKTRFIFYSSLCSFGLNIILNGVFYWLVGFIGPAIATLISQIMVNVVQLVFTSRVMSCRFRDILPWKELGSIAIIILILGIPFFVVRNLFTLSGIYGVMLSIALGMIWGGIYFLIMRKRLIYKWKELNQEENYEL